MPPDLVDIGMANATEFYVNENIVVTYRPALEVPGRYSTGFIKAGIAF